MEHKEDDQGVRSEDSDRNFYDDKKGFFTLGQLITQAVLFAVVWGVLGVVGFNFRFDVGVRVDDTDDLDPQYYIGAGQSF